MIAFGCPIISPEVYERRAAPGIERAREPDSEVLAIQAAGSIFRSYNLLLDQVAAREDLEGLVLLHEDAEILGRDFCARVRAALADPDVAVVGCVGARGLRSIAWWDRAEIVGGYRHRYAEFGGGELRPLPPGAAHGEVESVDGMVMCLSSWAVRNIRFDEALGPHWGYDFDYCRQVRTRGRKVVTAPLDVAHHHALSLASDIEPWIAAHMRAAEKWDVPEDEGNWRQRARRAEAEAVLARLQGAATLLEADARSAVHARRMREVTDAVSWRVTAPLRALNGRLREARGRRKRRGS